MFATLTFTVKCFSYPMKILYLWRNSNVSEICGWCKYYSLVLIILLELWPFPVNDTTYTYNIERDDENTNLLWKLAKTFPWALRRCLFCPPWRSFLLKHHFPHETNWTFSSTNFMTSYTCGWNNCTGCVAYNTSITSSLAYKEHNLHGTPDKPYYHLWNLVVCWNKNDEGINNCG